MWQCGGEAGGTGGGGEVAGVKPIPAEAVAGSSAPRTRGPTVAEMKKAAAEQWGEMKMSHQDQITKWLTLGKTSADTQWASPREDGLTDQTRMWVDDMFMIIGLQCQAYRTLGDKKYLDRAAKEMVWYLDQLQQPNGLFFMRRTRSFTGDAGMGGLRWGWRRC